MLNNSSLTNLYVKAMDIDTYMTDLESCIANNTQLTKICLSNLKISKDMIDLIFTLNLQSLRLSDVTIYDVDHIIKHLGNCNNLRKFVFTDVKFGDTDVKLDNIFNDI